MKLVLIGNDYTIALCQATERLGKIQCAKSYVDGSSLHNSPIYHQRLIDKQRARRYEQLGRSASSLAKRRSQNSR